MSQYQNHTCTDGTTRSRCYRCEQEKTENAKAEASMQVFKDAWKQNQKAQTIQEAAQAPKMQQFDTGATRSDDTNKPDPEGFLSPVVLEAYMEYMQEHRVQDDGKVRESDNWQKGMPLNKYMKSLWRHFFQLWQLHRGHTPKPELRAGVLVPVTKKSACVGVMFNVMGYLHVLLTEQRAPASGLGLLGAMAGGASPVRQATTTEAQGGYNRGYYHLGEQVLKTVGDFAPISDNVLRSGDR
jgi:hypothetical protein